MSFPKRFPLLIYAAFTAAFYFFGWGIPSISAATIIPTSEIKTDTTWTKAQSPFVINGVLTVRYGSTLTIEPGVVIKFNTTANFQVKGALNAQGTSADKIYFTSIKDDSIGGDTNSDGGATSPLPRDWLAIYVSGGTANLNNVVIRYGGGGLCDTCHSAGIFTFGRVTVSNSEISDNGRQGIFLFGGDMTVTSTEITRQDYGIWIVDVWKWDVAQNKIHDNALYGIFISTKYQAVDAANNWWGAASGPFHPADNPTGTGNRVSNRVNFIPWLLEEPKAKDPLPECCSNVAFIPGLQATRLELDGNRLWEPNRNADVDKLFLDEEGKPLIAGVSTEGIIGEAFGFNVYKNFIEFMDGLVKDETIAEWEAFPYDWRFSVRDIAHDGMVEKIEQLAASSRTGKATIITHSNGNFIAKLLISELEKQGKAGLVDKLVMVAGPQLGTPKAIAGLLHGDEQAIPPKIGIILNKSTAREFAENMPGAYTLLPSKKYFSEVRDPIIEFDPDVSRAYDFRGLYGDAIESQAELQAFLLGDAGGRAEPATEDTDAPNVLNTSLLIEATKMQDELDSWTLPDGIKIIQIAGWGLDTIRGTRYDDCDIPLCRDSLSTLDRELLFVHDGDGTVVVTSAIAMENVDDYYVNLPEHNRKDLKLRRNRDHADILEVEPLQVFIKSLIQEKLLEFPEHVSKEEPVVVEEDMRLRFRMHSPVSLDLYDSEGNHTGLISNPDPDSDLQRVEQQIPNSYYLEFGETKYAGIDTASTTKVVLRGLDEGTFTFEIDEVLGDLVIASSTFIDIPVIEGTYMVLEVQHVASSTSLQMDVDNDGIVDVTIRPGEGISTDELLGILRGVVRTLESPIKTEHQILKRIDKLEKILEKEFKNEKRQKTRTHKVISNLEQQIKKFEKKKLLTAEDVQELLSIVERIKAEVVR